MDATSLLTPISADAPCGPDLEYDPAFSALEASIDAAYADRAVGPEREDETPEWKGIAARATDLLARTRDLRLLTMRTKAWLHLRGVAGLADGLACLRQLLGAHWDAVHPQLGVQGDTEGVMRANALRSLCEARSVIAPLRAAPLLTARGFAPVCLRDLENHANGQPGARPPDTHHNMDAVFIGCDLDAFRETCCTIDAARADIAAIETLFSQRPGQARVRLSELSLALDSMARLLAPRLAVRLAERETRAARAVEPASPNLTPAPALENGLGPPPVATRDEVIRELDRLCAYFEQHEPSSPVPMLLHRAKRLTCMPFFDLVRELAPGGVAEIEVLRGPLTTEEA